MTRAALAFRDTRDANAAPLQYDYMAIPYSPTENHRLVQLQKLQQYLPMLLQSPAVDQEKLVIKLLDLLQMRDILAPPAPPMPPEMPGMPPGMPGMPPGMPGLPPEGMPPEMMAAPPVIESPDTLATGALPEGTELPPIPGPGGRGNRII